MANYLLAYKGGGDMATSEEEQAVLMTQWAEWFGALGGDLVDGGNPFGPSGTLASDGTVSDGAESGLTGYSIIEADSLEEALEKSKGCPILTSGGSVEVYEVSLAM